MAWTAPRTWVAAEKPPASTLNTHIRDNFKAIGDAWTAYTPALTAVTTNPTLGTGSSATGAYMQAGKLTHVKASIIFGTSGVAAGSGNYRISLPFAVGGTYSSFRIPFGTAIIVDSSASSRLVRFLMVPGVGSSTVALIDVAGVQVGDATPWVWAASDELSFSCTYEAA